MTPSERSMPVTVAVYQEMRRRWLLRLPGGVEMVARDTAHVEELARKHAPGSAIRFVNPAQRQQQEGSALVPPSAAPGAQGTAGA